MKEESFEWFIRELENELEEQAFMWGSELRNFTTHNYSEIYKAWKDGNDPKETAFLLQHKGK